MDIKQIVNLSSNKVVFGFLWVVAFFLYLPTLKAGWVIDASGWLYCVKHQTFWDYINRTQSQVASLYQFTQFITYLFYKVWGGSLIAYFLLYVTMHSINGLLLYLVTKGVFVDSGYEIQRAKRIAIIGTILFIICPHVSEVLVWKACYHYLQGFLFLMLSTYWCQKYQHTSNNKLAVYSALIFLCSAFSLEIFYLAPLFLLSIVFYYRFGLGYNKQVFRNTIIRFILPQVLILVIYGLVFHMVYAGQKPHVYNLFSQPISAYVSKPLKYIFHIFLLGRYFDNKIRFSVYGFCSNTYVLVAFYTIFFFGLIWYVKGLKHKTNASLAGLLLFVWICLTIAILMPLPFGDTPLLIFYDRYAYFAVGFIYVFLFYLLEKFFIKQLALALFIAFGAVNLNYTIKINTYWKHSAFIDDRLFRELPPLGNKIVLLLNVPENLQGVPMIGAQPEGEYKILRELFIDSSVKNQIYDVLSYNLTSLHDGVNIDIDNDSTLCVSFNQYGNWWWYEGHGASAYETPEYKVTFVSNNSAYRLTLKHPKEKYIVLYETDGMWRELNW